MQQMVCFSEQIPQEQSKMAIQDGPNEFTQRQPSIILDTADYHTRKCFSVYKFDIFAYLKYIQKNNSIHHFCQIFGFAFVKKGNTCVCLFYFRHVDLLLLICKIHEIHDRRGYIFCNIETYVAKPFLSMQNKYNIL